MMMLSWNASSLRRAKCWMDEMGRSNLPINEHLAFDLKTLRPEIIKKGRLGGLVKLWGK